MELRAILEALRAHPDQVTVILTDSQYAIDCVTTWLPGWRRRGWRRHCCVGGGRASEQPDYWYETSSPPSEVVPGFVGFEVGVLPGASDMGRSEDREGCVNVFMQLAGTRGADRRAGHFDAPCLADRRRRRSARRASLALQVRAPGARDVHKQPPPQLPPSPGVPACSALSRAAWRRAERKWSEIPWARVRAGTGPRSIASAVRLAGDIAPRPSSPLRSQAQGCNAG
jgi:hypothetical protein